MPGRVAVGTWALVRDRCRGRMALDDGEARKGTCLTGPVGFACPIGRCQAKALGRQASPSTVAARRSSKEEVKEGIGSLAEGGTHEACFSSDPAQRWGGRHAKVTAHEQLAELRARRRP